MRMKLWLGNSKWQKKINYLGYTNVSGGGNDKKWWKFSSTLL